METMRVFSWFSARPRSARNASTLGRTYRSRTSFDGAVTRKSSAYLIRTTLLSIPLFVTALTGLPSQSSQPKSRSIPSSATLANTGESTPPTILQNSAGGVRRVRAGWGMDWLDAKDDVHVLPVDFNPLDQQTDQF